MRLTSLEKVEAERLREYDADFHPMLVPHGQLKLDLVEHEPGRIRVRFQFNVEFREADSSIAHGKISGTALIKITDSSIPREIEKIPDHVLSLVQGGIADDVLLPVSLVARAMRLPNLLLSPVPITRETLKGASNRGSRHVETKP